MRWINTCDVALRYSVAESLEHENFCCAQPPGSACLRRADYNIASVQSSMKVGRGSRSVVNYRRGTDGALVKKLAAYYAEGVGQLQPRVFLPWD